MRALSTFVFAFCWRLNSSYWPFSWEKHICIIYSFWCCKAAHSLFLKSVSIFFVSVAFYCFNMLSQWSIKSSTAGSIPAFITSVFVWVYTAAIVSENIKGELKGHINEFVSMKIFRETWTFCVFSPLYVRGRKKKTIKRASKLASSKNMQLFHFTLFLMFLLSVGLSSLTWDEKCCGCGRAWLLHRNATKTEGSIVFILCLCFFSCSQKHDCKKKPLWRGTGIA